MTTDEKTARTIQPVKAIIEATDGWRLSLQVLETQQPNNDMPVLLVFPALAAPARIYVRMALSLAKMGYRLVLVDPRGIGESGPVASAKVDYSIIQHLEYDWPAVIAWAKGRYPSAPKVVVGHSLGGQLSAIYSGQHPGAIDAMILLNVPFVWYRSWPFPSSLALWSVYRGCSAVSGILGYFPANRFGLGQPVAKMVMKEWTRWGLKGEFTPNNRIDLVGFLGQVTGPVLSISFTDDWFYGPRSAVDDFAHRLTRSQLTRWHLSPLELDVKQLGHFRYLRSAPRLWERIHQWLELQITSQKHNAGLANSGDSSPIRS